MPYMSLLLIVETLLMLKTWVVRLCRNLSATKVCSGCR
uniref:Uncharacterized protein n=1 Tax=Arundo donax TaxID=35708 RepID=A0A0A9BJZ3_ARUDO